MISLETTDLFRGAFLLCMGARLDRVRVRTNGRAIATFLITGKDLDRLDRDSKEQKAAAMAFLKNPKLFDEILADLETWSPVAIMTNTWG